MSEETTIVLTKVPTCPYCGKTNNCFGGPTKPRKGDLVICPACRKTSLTEVDPLRLRKPEGKEEEDLCEGAMRQVLSSK